MPDSTPHKEGAASAVEALPGAAIATLLVYLLRGTRYAMDATTATAVVAAAPVISSYVMAWLRELRQALKGRA